MRKSADIYNYERILERVFVKIKDSSIDEESKANILEFLRDCTVQGLSKPRVIKYGEMLGQCAKLFGKPFSQVIKDDMFSFVQEIEERNYSDWTKRDYKIVIKRFFKWLRKSEDYPEEVRWIKAKIRKNNMLPEELLTEDEVKKMAEAASNPRDRALVLVLYESGCRIGEILSLKIKNVQFDDHGAQLIVNGKTGSRRVRILFSQAELASWINIHPLRNDLDAPLWITLGTNSRNSILNYRTACEILKETAKRAGIKKRIYPHLFRHSRATFLANHLTEAQMKQYFGWVQGSNMAATYVHLSGRDVDSALLKLQGIKVDEDNKESKLKVVVCPRCDEKNSSTSKFCCRCGSPLDASTAEQIDEYKSKAERLMNELIKNPKVLDALLEGIDRLKEEASQTNLSSENLCMGTTKQTSIR